MSQQKPQTDGLTRHYFEAFTCPEANDLVLALLAVQKNIPARYRGDWMQFVNDVVIGLDMDDARLFPSEGFPTEDSK